MTLLAAAFVLAGVVAPHCGWSERAAPRALGDSRARGTAWLWIAALVLAMARQFEIPGVEPRGYWPRWAMIWALTGLRPGPPDRAVAAPDIAAEPAGDGPSSHRPDGSPWWHSGSP